MVTSSVFTDSQFKLVVSLSLILLLFLAVLSTIQCQHKRLEYALKENFASSADASQVSVISSALSAFLLDKLTGSFPIGRFFGNLELSDVAVMLPLDLVYKRTYIDPVTPPADGATTDVDVTKITLDSITCPEHSQMYLASDSSHCSGVMQLQSSSQYSCRVRVAEAYYRIRSVCMKVVRGRSPNVIRVTPSLPGGMMLYLLQPFAIHDGDQLTKVTNIYKAHDESTVTVEGGMVVPRGRPHSIVAYYLDYVRPSPDFMQNWITGNKTAPKVKSYINMAGSFAFVNEFRVAFRLGQFDIQGNDGTAPAPVNYKTDGFIPGMPNLAKLAVKFGHLPKANTIESIEVDIAAEGCYEKNQCSQCKSVPTEESLSAFASADNTQSLPSNSCFTRSINNNAFDFQNIKNY